jgi:ABC-type Fe3+-siderophore transport system permease subunit
MASHEPSAAGGEKQNDATPRGLRRSCVWGAALAVLLVARGTQGSEPEPLASVPTVAVASLHAQRLLAALVSGASLATAGAVAQSVTTNPLADPAVLGTSGGAFLGAQLGLVASTAANAPLALRAASAVIGALGGAALALVALLMLARRARPLEFLLTGFLLAALFSGASTLVTALAQERPLLGRALVMLGLGDLASAGWPELRVAVPLAVGAIAGALLRRRDLDLLALGADEAQSLGLAVSASRAALVAWIACGTAASVILGGQLAFVGLLAPHLARRFVGGRHGALVPLAALFGGLVVVASDRLAVSLVQVVSVPAGAITTLAGAPFFFMLLRRRSGGDHGSA